MRLLADENFPAQAVQALRSRGHDVLWIRTSAPGLQDEQVLERARTEQRLLLMFDKDFGELAFRAGLSAPAGIVLFRHPPASPSEAARLAVDALESRSDWAGYFAVVEVDRIRLTPVPASGRRSNRRRRS